MAFEDLVQKAFYLGVGLASVASEKAGSKLGELSDQAQKAIADLVARGELTTEEARRMVESMMNQSATETATDTANDRPPRPIEILTDAEEPPETGDPDVIRLRREAQILQDKLDHLRRSQD
jgi:polyhydroxyalkanoate synthesis regulator phasin